MKEKKARQTPAKPAKSKSAKARAKPNPGAMRPRMEGSYRGDHVDLGLKSYSFTDPGIRRAVSHGSGSFWDSCRGRVASRCHGAPKTREKWGVGPQVMAVEIHEIQGAFT